MISVKVKYQYVWGKRSVFVRFDVLKAFLIVHASSCFVFFSRGNPFTLLLESLLKMRLILPSLYLSFLLLKSQCKMLFICSISVPYIHAIFQLGYIYICWWVLLLKLDYLTIAVKKLGEASSIL